MANLISAARDGKLTEVADMLRRGANVNQTTNDGYGYNALIHAASRNHVPVVKCLVEGGADIDKAGNDGKTALLWAGHLPVVKYLVEGGADISIADKDGKTALIHAAMRRNLDVVKYLVEGGADIDKADNDGKTALIHAAMGGHVLMVRYLVEGGADISIADKEGKTALLWAAMNGHLDVVKYLVEGGADIDKADNDGKTALVHAAMDGRVLMVRYLVEGGADISIADKEGYNALMRAASKNHVPVTEYLRVIASNDGKTALMLAAMGGHLDVVKCLVEGGADIDKADNNRKTALILALERGHLDVAEYLQVNYTSIAGKQEAIDQSQAFVSFPESSQKNNNESRDQKPETLLDSDEEKKREAVDALLKGLVAIFKFADTEASYIVEHLAEDGLALSTASSAQSSTLQKLFADIVSNQTKSSQRKALDSLQDALDKAPLRDWTHALAIKALVVSMPINISQYRSFAEEFIRLYLSAVCKENDVMCGAVLVVLARLAPITETQFRLACFALCASDDLQPWLSESELNLIKNGKEEQHVSLAKQTPQDELLAKWDKLKSAPGAPRSEAVESIMKMVGLQTVKKEVLEIYTFIFKQNKLLPESRGSLCYNFLLLGNAGTGKATVGEVLCKMLQELGIRKNPNLFKTSGEELARIGATKTASEIQKAVGGCILIDEAYHLNPKANSEGAAVAMQLLGAADTMRRDLSIILLGYKKDIEEKLMDFNPGFDGRFPYKLIFEDYTNDELGVIFKSICAKHKWMIANADVIAAAARRIGRKRGSKSFGNARDVIVLFEVACRRATMRDDCNQTLTIEDVLGPPPTPDRVPDLKSALEELDDLIGLHTVKEEIYRVVRLAQSNYDRELRGETPLEATLNRVFLGNSGTGKTTFAKLYGRILKGLGMLSNGSWELKLPKDFLGSAVGEAEKITSNLIERCMGKVLIIDEAYGLHGSAYGKAAIDTLVGLVHNAPGEDIAVVMMGYEKDIRRMCREANDGLTSRISLNNPLMFEDYTDRELERIALQSLQKDNLTMSSETCRLFIKSISAQRFAPKFGNGRVVISAITNAKIRMADRDEFARDISQTKIDPLGVLDGLFKVEHIANEVRDLKSVIEQCKRDNIDKSKHLKSYVLVGNSGTGKSTFADILAKVLFELGFLGSSLVVRRTGLDMQAGYVGQTKDKVNEAMAEAQGGVLFIDEAYTMGSRGGGSYSQESVDQLVGLMTEKEHLNRTVVILAGYPAAMNHMLSSNEGLRSRFSGMIEFPDWDASDCVKYIDQQCIKEGFMIESSAMRKLERGLLEISGLEGWANARDCQGTLTALYRARAVRGAVDKIYTLADVDQVIEGFLKLRKVCTPSSDSVGPDVQFKSFDRSHTPPPLPVVERISETQIELQAACESKLLAQEDDNVEDGLFATLLIACVEAGYDSTHETRQELIAALERVQQGERFPEDIMTIVEDKSKLSEDKATKMLRPQINIVLEGMRGAVRAEEDRRAEVVRQQEEERRMIEQGRIEEARRQEVARRAQEREDAAKQEELRKSGRCAMGYSWHKEGSGWRCNGGSHYCG